MLLQLWCYTKIHAIHDDAVIDWNLQLFENRLPENTEISNFRTWLKYLLDWSKWFQNLNICYLDKAFLHAMGDSYLYFVSGNETNRKRALFSDRSSEMKMGSQANIVWLKYKMLVIILKTLKVSWHLPTLLFSPQCFLSICRILNALATVGPVFLSHCGFPQAFPKLCAGRLTAHSPSGVPGLVGTPIP